MHFSHPLYGAVDNMGFCSLNDISLNSDLQGSFVFSEVSFDHNLTSTPIQLANLSKSSIADLLTNSQEVEDDTPRTEPLMGSS